MRKTLEILTNEKKYYNKFEKILRIILFEKHIFKKHFFFFQSTLDMQFIKSSNFYRK